MKIISISETKKEINRKEDKGDAKCAEKRMSRSYTKNEREDARRKEKELSIKGAKEAQRTQRAKEAQRTQIEKEYPA